MKDYASLKKISLAGGLLVTLGVVFSYYPYAGSPSKRVSHTTDADLSTRGLPIIAYQETIFDFGTLTAGELAKHEFSFTNQGHSPLVIYEVIPSCNLCTQATWTRQAIQPGQKGTIQVTFNSTGRSGKQGKYLIVRANTDPADTRLLIRGEVQAQP